MADLFQGKGEAVYKNGYSYSGAWIKGERYGFGIYRFPNGKIRYEGNWKDDVFHGEGRLVEEDGKEMKGQFEKGYFYK